MPASEAAPGRRRVLWVTEERPDRTLGGGSVRQAHLFEAVAAAMDVDLLVAGRVEDERVRAAAHRLIERDIRLAFTPTEPDLIRQLHWTVAALLSPRPWYAYGAGPRRRRFASHLRRHAADYDLVILEHTTLAPLLEATGSTPALLTMHQVVSTELEQELAVTGRARRRWLLSRDLAKARRLELAALLGFDQIAVCSEADAAALELALPPDPEATLRRPVAVVPNGVELSEFPPTPVPSEPRVLFPGSFHFPPNIHGAEWLCGEIWPRVRAAVPGATLELAGRDPDPRVVELARGEGISLHPNVPSMAPHFQRARAVVVPLRVGSGTRLKALEALSSGRPVVGTTIGLDGIGVRDGNQARIADDADALARALVEVLTDDGEAARLARAGRAHVEARFGWERVGRDYVALLHRLIGIEAQRRNVR